MRNIFVTAAVAAAAFAVPASAATVVSTSGPSSFAAPATAGGLTVDFNSAVAAPFTATYNNAALVQGDLAGQYAEPMFSDRSQYAAVLGNGSLTLASSLAFRSISFFVGSIDASNLVELLGADGTVIAAFNGTTFSVVADGDQDSNLTNRRVTIALTTEAPFSGVRFSSAQNSFELDNVVFAAVPEASTWALMLVGFGMVGAAVRYRRRKSTVAFS